MHRRDFAEAHAQGSLPVDWDWGLILVERLPLRLRNAKPAFNLIEPRPVRQDEMEMFLARYRINRLFGRRVLI
jgi:hypothetical protein